MVALSLFVGLFLERKNTMSRDENPVHRIFDCKITDRRRIPN